MRAFLLAVAAAVAIAGAAYLVLHNLDWSAAAVYSTEAVRL